MTSNQIIRIHEAHAQIVSEFSERVPELIEDHEELLSWSGNDYDMSFSYLMGAGELILTRTGISINVRDYLPLNN